MIKKRSFTVQSPNKKIGGWAKFQQWNRKWNKIMSGIFCVLTFALLFGIVMVNTTSTDGGKQENIRNVFGKSINCRLYSANESTGIKCDVLCSHINTENLIAEVEATIENDNSGCSSTGYHLRYDEPQVSIISPGWFKTTAIIYKVTIRDVGIANGKVMEIEPGAFNDCTFRRMTELVIRRTPIKVLKRGVFDGANSLKSLTMEENGLMHTIERFTLDPLYQLTEMKMTAHPQLESLANFTGTTQLRHLRTLNLSFNNFGKSIDAETFRGCTNIEALNLSNSSIQAIGAGAFDPMIKTLRFLDLSNNQLKRLQSKLLELLTRPHMQIYLSNNSWQCDCDSADLKMWTINNASLIFDSPLMCDTPPLENGKNITDLDLSECDPNTTFPPDPTPPNCSTNNTTTTELPTTTKTTEQAPQLIERLDCINEKNESGTLYLEKAHPQFTVKQLELGKVLVEILSLDTTLSMVVTNNKDEPECRYDINRQMYFDSLDETAVHLFCLIKKTAYATSPRNCYPFRFDNSKSIWGHDEIIIALVCSTVLSLVVGVLCGWLLSCRYQRVFKAKESLQYQLSARSTSKTVTEIEDFNSSITSDYFSGARHGSDGGPNGNRRLRRTHSDNSIISCKSYITAVTPSPFEIIQWKLRKNAMSCSNDYQVRDYLDKLEYDCLPPPLPPHPNRCHIDKIYETIGEPVYTSTSGIVPYDITYATNASS